MSSPSGSDRPTSSGGVGEAISRRLFAYHGRSRSTSAASSSADLPASGGPVQEVGISDASGDTAASSSKSISGNFQDRLFAKVLQGVVPSDYSIEKYAEMKDKRKDEDRPAFSLTLMSGNFRRFNARVGVVFVFQHRLLRLVLWKQPIHTLSALAVYSFVCMDPQLLAVLPLAAVLFFVMVPAYIARHPPPPHSIPGRIEPYSAHGGAIAPPPEVRAVSEMSKDFFRNLRDLQNTMADFSDAHDKIIATIGPPTNFSNEKISSGVFQFIFLLCIVLFIGSFLVPWKLVMLISGWTIVACCHPRVQQVVINSSNSEFSARERKRAANRFSAWVEKDIILDEAPEQREVEIFELQRRTSTGYEWEPWMFSGTPYEPLSPARIAGNRPKGTRFFEDVRPPAGWEWLDKTWTLDLGSKTWVSERCINNVEVDEDKERWVYDWEDTVLDSSEEEDAHGGVGEGRRGEWRRRRWVRLVIRKRYQSGYESD